MKYFSRFIHHNDKGYFVALFIIAIILSVIFFSPVKSNQFLFIHDQFFPTSFYETFINSFFLRIPENLSVINAWYLTWFFWDKLYFLLIYSLNFSHLIAEQLLFFIVLFLSMSLSFLGFSKLALYFDKSINKSKIFIVSLWYCLNPYTLNLWHTGNFNLSLSLTHSLAPLIIYYLHLSMFSKFNLRNIIIFVLILYFASPVFWLFASIAFFLFIYTSAYLIVNIKQFKLKSILKNFILAILLYSPLVSFIVFSIFYQLYNSIGDSNSYFLATYGSEKGGMLYQMLLYSSWAIYTYWYPRTLFSFSEYYFSSYYLLSTLSIYGIIGVGLFSYIFHRLRLYKGLVKNVYKTIINQQDKLILLTLLLFIVSVFFAKADQSPFGGIFTYLYTHFSFFTVFRSPDSRFGFLIILTISLLLLYLSKYIHKIFYFISILLIIIIQNIYLLNGVAIFGENVSDKYFDRITYYSTNQQQLTNFLNNSITGSSYVLSIPSVQFGFYNIDKNEKFIGQDLLAKNIKLPFLYILESKCTSQICAISENTNQQLLRIVKSNKLRDLKQFPIKYVLHRRDINCPSCLNIKEENLNNNFKKVFNNSDYSVYEINNYSPIINAKSVDIKYVEVNPIKYNVELKNLKSATDINLLLSYNKDWKIYPRKDKDILNCRGGRILKNNNVSQCIKPKILFEGEELSYIWQQAILENNHGKFNQYANKWTIGPDYVKRFLPATDYTINKDGSININLTVYFAPQSWLYFTFILSTVFLVSMVIYLFSRKFRKPKNSM